MACSFCAKIGLWLWLRRSHPLAQKKLTDFQAIGKFPIVLREAGSMTRTLFLEEAARQKMALSSVTEIASREAVSEAVAQGLGIGIVSEGEIVPDPRLKHLQIRGWDAKMREWLVWLAARADLQLVSAFLKIARTE